jgi:voltage-gated potassium channel Kch
VHAAVQCAGYRVGIGKASDLPVYFGDAGSPAVLHQVGAERAACAVVTLDTPGANYRTVWAMHKHFPEIKTYVRAHDINHGINLEKAGATVVVPETLEPSMQLAANVLTQFNLPPEEINTHLDNFRKKHLRELQALAALSGAGRAELVAVVAFVALACGLCSPASSNFAHGMRWGPFMGA